MVLLCVSGSLVSLSWKNIPIWISYDAYIALISTSPLQSKKKSKNFDLFIAFFVLQHTNAMSTTAWQIVKLRVTNSMETRIAYKPSLWGV